LSSSLIKWVLDLDVGKFQKNLKDANEEVKSLGSEKNLTGLINSVEQVVKGFVAFKAVGVVADMAQMALNASLTAENIETVNRQFEMLANGAGIAGDELKDSLEKASGGLVGMEEMLQVAGKSIVAMGANAKKLPEVMEMARKATSAFGGDLLQNFEIINQAIQSGNARMLKQIGLNVDAEKAYKDYAKSIGATVDQLTEEGKQYALMNAVLKQGSDKFKNVQADSRELADNVVRLKEAFKGLKDTVAIVFDKVLGPAIKGTVEAVSYAASWWDKFFKKTLLNDGGQATKKAGEDLKALGEAAKESAQTVSKSHVKAVDPAEKVKAEGAYYTELNRMRAEYVQNQIKTAQDLAQWEAAKKQEQLVAEEAYQAQRTAKESELRNNFLISESQKKIMLEQMELSHKERLRMIDEQYANQKKAFLEEVDRKAYESQNSFEMGWNKAAKAAAKGFGDFRTLGTQAFTAVQNRGASAFIALGEGSQNASEAMRGFIFGALADIAENQGKIMLAQGFLGNAPAAAAGAGLLALAGFLRSQARATRGFGGADTGGAGTPGFGGAIVSPDNRATPEEAPRKSVTLQVMGNIYETDETKTRLVELIRQATDATDFKYQQIGVG
jgi:hypothetical protein